MTTPSDHDLLRRFDATRDEAAFAAIVERHIDLVHGIARRSTQNPADTDDITQAVFLLLTQKPPRLSENVTLAGWLFRATHYCCLNLKKAQRRRDHHEQSAGATMHDPPPPASPDLTALLDEALAALPRTTRDAVLLRYLEGRSVEDSAALALSPAATQRRAARGLEQLRARFARHGHFASSATVLAAFAHEQTQHAAPSLVTLIHTAVGAGAPAAKTLLLAKATGNAMTGALSKMLVTGAIVLAAGTMTGAVLLHYRVPPETPRSLVAGAPTTAPVSLASLPAPPPPVDETRVPGNTDVAVYSLLLDPAAADSLRNVLRPIPADASFYALHRASAQRVRDAIQGAVRAHHFVTFSTFFRRMSIDHHVINLGTDAEFWRLDLPGAKGYFDFKHLDGADPSADNLSVQLHIHFAPQDADLNLMDSTTREEAHLIKPAGVQWDGSVTAGDALVLLGDFGPWHHDHLLTATIYEVFKANEYQEQRINNMFDTSTWIEQGPTGARALADRAWIWGHQDTRPPAAIQKTAATWSRTLSDGATVRLLGLARPSQWPYCWWDGDGFPTAAAYFQSEVNFNTPFAVAVSVRRRDGSSDERDNAFERLLEGGTLVVPPSTSRLSVYVAIGPWIEHPLKLGESMDLGDHSVMITKTGPWGPGHSNVFLTGDWEPDYQLKVRAVLKDGKILDGPFLRDSAVCIPETSGPLPDGDAEYFASPLKNIDHYLIATRHREYVTFEHFATVPTIIPAPATP